MATAASSPVFVKTTARSPIEYWHLLSLDAPTVAGLWSCAFSRSAHVRAEPSAILLLCLGTWLLYVADRVLDGLRAGHSIHLRERHRFHARHRSAFFGVSVAVVSVLCLLSEALSQPALRNFCWVLAAALIYFALVHSDLAAVKRWLPKELAVGVIFAAGVAAPAWSHLPPGSFGLNLPSLSLTSPQLQILSSATLFAGLCWLNCVAIEAWEQSQDLPARSGSRIGRIGRRSSAGTVAALILISRSPIRRVRSLACVVAGSSVLLCVRHGLARHGNFPVLSGQSSIYISVLVSAVVLLFLDLFLDEFRVRLSPIRLRIAADAALLTPILFLAMPHF